MNCRSSIICPPQLEVPCLNTLAQGLPVLPARNKSMPPRLRAFRQPSLTPKTAGPKWRPLAKTRAKSARFYLFGGAVAQLGERLVRNEEVRGSTPLGSTTPSPRRNKVSPVLKHDPEKSTPVFGKDHAQTTS